MKRRLVGYAAALLAPIAVTVGLLPLSVGTSRDYIFIYIAVVAGLGVAAGLVPALLAAGMSFLLVDWFFVAPLHTLSITDQTDVVNLLVFFGAAGVVGGLGSRRRTTQLRAEALAQELRRANSDLERLNREQAEAAAVAVRLARTEQQVHALEETDRLRAELLANVSHELRTPLATILTGTSGLLDDPVLRLPSAARSRASSGRPNVSPGSCPTCSTWRGSRGTRCVSTSSRSTFATPSRPRPSAWRAPRPRASVVIDVDGPLEVIADWGRLGQVLDNLLNNADRYAPPGTPIRVEAAPGKRSMVVMRVIDSGPGRRPRPARAHLRALRPLRRRRRRGAGRGRRTGLGLAIVRGIVEAHAGRVWVEEPREGGGGRFAFALPSADRSAVAGEDVHVDVDDQADQPSQRA